MWDLNCLGIYWCRYFMTCLPSSNKYWSCRLLQSSSRSWRILAELVVLYLVLVDFHFHSNFSQLQQYRKPTWVRRNQSRNSALFEAKENVEHYVIPWHRLTVERQTLSNRCHWCLDLLKSDVEVDLIWNLEFYNTKIKVTKTLKKKQSTGSCAFYFYFILKKNNFGSVCCN